MISKRMERMKLKEWAGRMIGGLVCLCAVACQKDQTPPPPEEDPDPPVPVVEFASGADISWVTAMEQVGVEFYNAAGERRECTALMKEIGMNAIRLRVWVDPSDGWCAKADVVAKARRAQALGMRLLIDFHYSDSWADPAKQYIPAAWSGYALDRMKRALADHTVDVLSALKAAGVQVEWVQVGNETSDGMLWPMGKASTNMANYAQLTAAGYEAVKSVYPEAKVIVHLDRGDEPNHFIWLFDGLKQHGGKWDVIGMSLYPETATWSRSNAALIATIRTVVARYGTDCMIVEVGMERNDPVTARACFDDLFRRAMQETGGRCLGILYWEPECYAGFGHYSKGAFTDDGRPSAALEPFDLSRYK